VSSAFFWQLERENINPNAKTTMQTVKKLFFIFIISYTLFISAQFFHSR